MGDIRPVSQILYNPNGSIEVLVSDAKHQEAKLIGNNRGHKLTWKKPTTPTSIILDKDIHKAVYGQTASRDAHEYGINDLIHHSTKPDNKQLKGLLERMRQVAQYEHETGLSVTKKHMHTIHTVYLRGDIFEKHKEQNKETFTLTYVFTPEKQQPIAVKKSLELYFVA